MKDNTPAAKAASYGKPSIGCYCDGANGQAWNDRKVLRLALSYGWTSTEAIAVLEKHDNSEDTESDDFAFGSLVEEIASLTEDAETYLNSLESRPFTSWYWDDGDFGLWPNVDGAREDCEFVSSRKQDYPEDGYTGEWLHVSDHGNATLYVRGEDGKDVEIWGVV